MRTEEEIIHLFGSHPATSVTGPMHEQIRVGFIAFAKWLKEELPDTEARDMVYTKLKEASMWANFAVAELAPVENLPLQRETLFDDTVPPRFR